MHKQFRDYVASLNRFYLKTPELWELDFDARGFEWICADDNEKNAVSFYRLNKNKSKIGVIVSFSGADQEFVLQIDKKKEVDILFESSDRSHALLSYNSTADNNDVTIRLGAFSGIVFRIKEKNIVLK